MKAVSEYIPSMQKSVTGVLTAGVLLGILSWIGHRELQSEELRQENIKAVKQMAIDRARECMDRRRNPQGPMVLTKNNAEAADAFQLLVTAHEQDLSRKEFMNLLKDMK